MDETEPAIPPLGEEMHSSETEYERGWRNAMNQVNVPEVPPPVTHWLDPYEKETALTRRFYLLLLGLIVIATLIAVIIMALDNGNQSGNIAAVAVIGGVATGALASLAAHDRR
jgi:hypothetical protein